MKLYLIKALIFIFLLCTAYWFYQLIITQSDVVYVDYVSPYHHRTYVHSQRVMRRKRVGYVPGKDESNRYRSQGSRSQGNRYRSQGNRYRSQGNRYRSQGNRYRSQGSRYRSRGRYYFRTSNRRVWINRSFRRGSLSGRRRGGGIHAGK